MKSSLQALILVTCTALSLCACGHDDSSAPAYDDTPAAYTGMEGDTDDSAIAVEPLPEGEGESEEPSAEQAFELSDPFDSGLTYNGINPGREDDEMEAPEGLNQQERFGN